MKLIFIHGRAQEEYEELELKKSWEDTLKEGLQKSGLTLPGDLKIEFPYYGKLLKSLVDNVKSPTIEETTRGLAAINPAEYEKMAFFQDFLTEIADKTDFTEDEKAELLESQEDTRGFLNWESVQKLLTLMDKKQVIGEMAIKSFTYDVFLYLTNSNIRKSIDELVFKSFDYEPCVVVGHSLGTIVSYLTLKNNPQLNVKKFITVGSPLGSASIKKYLDLPLKMPDCVQNGWFNAYDERDVVALNPLDNTHFDILPTKIDNKNDVNNQTDNRHGIVGYLNDAVVAKKIYDALMV